MASPVLYRITFEKATASWVLRQDGSAWRADKYHTKEAAITEGRRLATQKGGTLVVHGKDGSIEAEWTFKPHRPSGKRS